MMCTCALLTHVAKPAHGNMDGVGQSTAWHRNVSH